MLGRAVSVFNSTIFHGSIIFFLAVFYAKQNQAAAGE
jgi:hypothetical protein